ncbi:MAG: hypothetical protein V3575_01945, partial [Candidatus Absconditabacteria bacterium]
MKKLLLTLFLFALSWSFVNGAAYVNVSPIENHNNLGNVVGEAVASALQNGTVNLGDLNTVKNLVNQTIVSAGGWEGNQVAFGSAHYNLLA